MEKPVRLRRGDSVAVLSPSTGLPSVFPHVYDLGIRNLEERFGVKIQEYPTARLDAESVYEHPELRAQDINAAFSDPGVKAIVATIGGDDSIRVLRDLDQGIILANPKILMGASDITIILAYLNQLGLVTYYGPTIMAGFSQLKSLHTSFSQHLEDMLFNPRSTYSYSAFPEYSEGYPDWGMEENLGKVNPPKRNKGWDWVQGEGRTQGVLFGGCVDVLEFMKGTRYWPQPEFWRNKILFLETSEEKPSPHNVKRWLRNYGIQGIFDKIHGLLFGRARGYSDGEKKMLTELVQRTISKEFGRPELPIVMNMDFGHTDPQWVLPLGVDAEIDVEKKTFKLLEPSVG